jgi:ABC-type dipeptide/oligopeptide/nickel transport system ATPase component
VTTQAQILQLLVGLQAENGITIVLISHDLAVIRQACDRVAVMKDGRILELTDAQTLYTTPRHAYSKELLAAVPGLPGPSR